MSALLNAPPAVTPTEAAVLTGLTPKVVHTAIDQHEVELAAPRVGPRVPEQRQQRTLGVAEIVYLALREELMTLLTTEGRGALYRELRRLPNSWRTLKEPPAPDIAVGPLVIELKSTWRRLAEGLREFERAHAWVVSEPSLRRGEPVVRGTRIPVAVLADLAAQGAPEEELLEDYPALTPESLRSALIYARMYPRRGRPRGTRSAPEEVGDTAGDAAADGAAPR